MLADWLTTGDFADEPAAVAALRSALGEQWFKPAAEVPGQYMFSRPGTGSAQPRADLILWPRADALAAGWTLGPIGVECKRSGVKLGGMLAQVLDYQAAVFYPAGTVLAGVGVVPSVWALWPAGQPRGPLDSILAHRGICTVDTAPWGAGVVFKSGGRNILRVSPDRLEAFGLVAGRKRGSRG